MTAKLHDMLRQDYLKELPAELRDRVERIESLMCDALAVGKQRLELGQVSQEQFDNFDRLLENAYIRATCSVGV